MYWKALILAAVAFCTFVHGQIQTKKFKGAAHKFYSKLELSDEDYLKVMSAHRKLRNQLTKFFQKQTTTKIKLYLAAREYRDQLLHIEQEYFSDVDNIVMGNKNTIAGGNNHVHGKGHLVIGWNNYVFKSRYNHIPIKGDNILRIKHYDVDMDLIQLIKFNPYKAIVILN